MTAFRALQAAASKPAEVVELQPGHFADTWPDKPKGPVSVGLRLVSEADFQTARAEASRRAWQTFPDEDLDVEERVDCFNDNLAAWVVARATTQPDNASAPWMELAHDNLQFALTTGGLRFLFDRVVALTIERSPLSPEITDAEMGRLCGALKSGVLLTGAGAEVRLARRLLRRVMDHLGIG